MNRLTKLSRFVILLGCALVIFTGDLQAQGTGIWITGPLEKVLQTKHDGGQRAVAADLRLAQ